jgi:hypothetical protein
MTPKVVSLKDHIATTFIRGFMTPERQKLLLNGGGERLVRAAVRAGLRMADIYLEERDYEPSSVVGGTRDSVSELRARIVAAIPNSPDAQLLRDVLASAPVTNS